MTGTIQVTLFRPLLALAALLLVSADTAPQCRYLQKQLDQLSTKLRGACRCYISMMGQEEGRGADEEAVEWVGCTQREVLIIHEALNALPNDSALARLWIWDSLIPVIPVDIFTQVRPRQLFIDHSLVGKFDEGALDPLGPTLLSLDLKNNVIRSLHGRLFQNLTSLARMDISGNQILRLNASSFANITSLTTLSLQRNQLANLADGTFVGLPNLQRLNLASNFLTSLNRRMFTGLAQLEYLNLENNRIQTIEPDTFAHLTNLKILNLGGNNISSVDIQGLFGLEKLHLENNSFTSVDNLKLSKLPALEILSLDMNKITGLGPRAFAGLPALASLSIIGNGLRSVDAKAFEGSGDLSVLSLQNNELGTLPDAAFPAGLQHLFLSGNLLEEVGEETLAGLPELRALSLARNRLSALHPLALSSSTRLRRLHLNHNNLQSLDPELLASIQLSIKNIDISSNPWLCNCTSFWLSEWTRQHIDQLLSPKETLCAGGEEMLLVDAAVGLGETCGAGGGGGGRSGWVTGAGLALGLLSLLTLGTLLALYLVEARKQESLVPSFRRFAIRRVPSDLVGLITDDGPLLHPSASDPPPKLTHHHPTGQGKSVRFNDP